MSARPERWILCGGASHPDAPDDAVALSVAGDEKNLTVDVAGITETLTGRVPPAFRDLILIASYVLAADQAVKRGDADDTDMGKKWRRTFRFVIGVEADRANKHMRLTIPSGGLSGSRTFVGRHEGVLG